MPSSSKDEMAPRLVSSRPWLDERRTKVRRDESDARPPVPAPCVNVARRSRDGARVDSPSARDPLDEKRLEERAPACVPVDTTRTRERVNATTYRCRSGITTVSPLSRKRRRGKHARKSLPHLARGSCRVGEGTPDRGDPHVSRCAESKRSRPHPKHLSRKIATRGRGRGDGGVRGGARAMGCAGRQRPTPPELDPPKRARCRETPSAPVSRGLRPVVASVKALRSSVSRGKTRSPHDTMGARFRIRG
jgi:hypothetical protein